MKRLLAILLILVCAKSFGQTFPITQSMGSKNTLVKTEGAFGSSTGFVFSLNYGDTATANSVDFISHTPGILIRVNDTLWSRNATANKWIKQGGGGGGGSSFTAGSGIDITASVISNIGRFGKSGEDIRATAARSFSFANNNMTWDSLGIATYNLRTGLSGQYNVNKNGFNRLTVSQSETKIYSPDQSSFVQATTNLAYISSIDKILLGSVWADQYARDSLYWRMQDTSAFYKLFPGLAHIYAEDSVLFQSEASYYRFSKLLSTTDTSTFKPIGADVNGKVKKISSWPSSSLTLSPIGFVANTTFPGVSIPSDWTSNPGGATYTVSSGVTLSGTGNLTNNYLKANFVSSSNNFTLNVNFNIVTKPTTHAQGFAVARIGSPGSAQLYLVFKYAGATDSGRLQLVSGSTVLDSTAAIAMADGNSYNIFYSQSNNTMFYRISLLSGGNPIVVKEKIYRLPLLWSTVIMPNQGPPALVQLGGSFKITLFQQYDNDLVGANLLIIGTSISQGNYANSFESHYISKALEGTGKTWVNYGSSSATYAQGILALPEVYLANPRAVGIEAGVNDVCANLRNWMPIIDSLQAHGFPVFWIKDYQTDVCKDSVIQNMCTEQGIILIDAFLGLAAADFPDGTHPDDHGFIQMAQNCKAQGSGFFGTTGSISGYALKGLPDVQLASPQPANGDILSYSTVTNKWSNIVPTTTAYINNQIASAQSAANFWIAGSGAINGRFSAGSATGVDATYSVFVDQNTSNGAFIKMTNDNNSANFTLSQMGSSGFSITGWANAGVMESTGAGGLTLSAQGGGPMTFQVGASRTIRGSWNTGGEFLIGTTDNGAFTFQNNGASYISTTESIATTTATDALNVSGNVSMITAGNKLKITEGSNGSVGQTTLVSGTKAITITGLSTNSRAFVQLVTPSGATLTIQYQAVCTANTLTIQANVAATTINTADGSTLNYIIIN